MSRRVKPFRTTDEITLNIMFHRVDALPVMKEIKITIPKPKLTKKQLIKALKKNSSMIPQKVNIEHLRSRDVQNYATDGLLRKLGIKILEPRKHPAYKW